MKVPFISSFFRDCQRFLADPLDDGLQLVIFACGFVAGLFVLLAYAHTLSYTVTEIPAILQDLLPWKYGDLHPEPWEGSLYHIGFTLVTIVTITVWFLLHKYLKSVFATNARALKVFFTAALLGFGLWFTVLHVLYADQSLDSTSLLPLSLFAWPVAGLCLLVLYYRQQVAPFIPRGKWSMVVEILLIGVFIVWLCYDPTSLHSVYPTNGSDYEWFLTPAHDALRGKHILVESFSQYGLFLFYFLSIFFRFLSITQAHFSVILIGLHIVYFSLLYLLLRIIFTTRSQTIISFIIILAFSYFMNEARFEFYAQPSITRLRNFWDMPVFLCMALELKTRKKYWLWLLAFISGFASLYNMDIGFSLALTSLIYAASLPVLEGGQHSAIRVARDAFTRCGIIIAGILLWIVVFNVFILLSTKGWPHWSSYFEFLSLYSAGFGGLPMPIIGAYWWVLLSYFISFLVVFCAWLGKRYRPFVPMLLAVSFYGILVFHYYLGRSYIANLWVITLPASLCACLLVSAYYERCTNKIAYDTFVTRFIRYGVAVLASIIFASAITVVVRVGSKMMNDRYIHPIDSPVNAPEYAHQFEASVYAITSRIPFGQRAAVFSNRDSIFTLAADRPNAFEYSTMDSVFTRKKLEQVLTVFFAQHHHFLFVDQSPINCHECDAVLPLLKQFYTLQTSEGLLDVYVRNDVPDPPAISFSTQ